MLLLLLGCAPLPPPQGLPQADNYATAHAEATVELRIVQHFETRLLMRATLIDEDVARAQALALAHAHRDNASAYDARLIEITENARASWGVVFAADDPAGREAFSLDEEQGWSLHLYEDGAPLEGLSLEKLDEDDTDLALLYPQLNRWSTLWEARFERRGDGRQLTLDVASARGQGAITWDR